MTIDTLANDPCSILNIALVVNWLISGDSIGIIKKLNGSMSEEFRGFVLDLNARLAMPI
jgi:hypothetical protein